MNVKENVFFMCELPNVIQVVIVLLLLFLMLRSDRIIQIVKKQELFYKKQTSNHWPCNPKPNPDLPHTYGKELPIVTKIKDPILNDIGMSLAGF